MTPPLNTAAQCRVCGCTEDRACLDLWGDPCRWVEPDLCSACAPGTADDFRADDDDGDQAPDLGPCCACGHAIAGTVNLMMLDRRAPVPGTGWGCVTCGLPLDGAVAVVCDSCRALSVPIFEVCRGYPITQERAPIGKLSDQPFNHTHEHD